MSAQCTTLSESGPRQPVVNQRLGREGEVQAGLVELVQDGQIHFARHMRPMSALPDVVNGGQIQAKISETAEPDRVVLLLPFFCLGRGAVCGLYIGGLFICYFRLLLTCTFFLFHFFLF